ncbi:DUF6544 family protein [Pseudoalteromonas sp. T1lg10]|uniref:DUF6544 family protein n=1 Tax=Pseudoalteromonas sp. T1lg10 TaxID=2077093 RepID=UPI000CF6257C|nr:DUF6544 family protein [Pseudoalteromonas sp. T1lg10]
MTQFQLPEQVLKFARRNTTGESAGVLAVQLTQKGRMRLGPEKPWAPFQATQVISAKAVEFEWTARVKLAPFLWVKVLDAYQSQRGNLGVKLWGVIPVASAQGPSIDQGEIQRYLAELPWCPYAFFANSTLNFKELEEDTVRVWFANEQTYVDLIFDAHGDIMCSRSETRVREGVGRQPWVGVFEEYLEIAGMRLPLRATVRWDTPDGPFEYWQGEIVSIKVFRVSGEDQQEVHKG